MSKENAKGSSASTINKLGIEDELTENKLLEHPAYKELQEKLTAAEEKATQNWDRALRIQAEMDNTQRRVERDIANAHKYALEKFVSELLPVVDNLERALDHEGDELEGVKMTLKSFLTVMEKFGVEQVNPLTKPFNPDLHQAVSTQDDASMKPGTVLSVMQKGYLLNGRLIRPALVVVSKNGA